MTTSGWRDRQARAPMPKGWRKTQQAQLAREPMCRPCAAKGIATFATQVDHITPRHKGGTEAASNLQSICAPCHTLKTAQESAEARGAVFSGHVRVKKRIGVDGWPV
jgi:5-methylcytosine-specific restriction protein A